MYKTSACPWTLSSEGSARKRARTELEWCNGCGGAGWPGAPAPAWLDPAVVEIDFLGCKFRSHLTIPLTLGELLDALRA